MVNQIAHAREELARRMRAAQDAVFFRIRESAPGRVLLRATEFVAAPRDAHSRRRLARAYNLRVSSATMEPDGGYCLLTPDYFAEFEPAFAAARRLFDVKRREADERPEGFDTWPARRQAKYLAQKRSFLHDLLTSDDLRREPELVDFALSDKMLGVATKYLGTVPHLRRVDLLYSQPRGADDNVSSQLYHVDPEGVTQVKFFIYLFDVGEPQGPFTFIPADDSDRVLRAVRSERRKRGVPHVSRYRDEEVASVPHRTVCLTGPAGAGVAVDTSRCLHLGSRVHPGTFRLCLFLQYCTAPVPGSHVFEAARFQADPVRYMAVSHSAA